MMTGNRTSFRAMLAVPARRLVSGATDRRFDALETGLSQILTRIAEMEQLMVRAEAEAAALRQQADETLAFLRVQHDITRDLLEELRPVLDRSRGVD